MQQCRITKLENFFAGATATVFEGGVDCVLMSLNGCSPMKNARLHCCLHNLSSYQYLSNRYLAILHARNLRRKVAFSRHGITLHRTFQYIKKSNWTRLETSVQLHGDSRKDMRSPAVN